MKKKKVIFDSFSFGSGTGSAGWNLFRFLCTGSGCSNFQKADRICEKKAEAGTITIRTEKNATGWYKSAAGNQYYFGKTGAAKAGILTISGKKVLF